jgi:endonuclease/exonuclease/phosphatase (EEP) superfamily protein YafD
VSTKKNGIGYCLFLSLCISAIAFSLAEYLSSWHRYFEFTTGYKLQFLLMGLCSLTYFLLTRRKLGIVLSWFCILINLAEVVPWYVGRSGIAFDNYQPLTALSYNVLWSNENYDRAIALIAREQPDIAIFQEAVPHWHTALTALKPDFPYHIREEKLEMEVYSKLPLLNPKTFVYGSYRGLITADIKIGERSVKLIATHAYPQLYWGHGGWKIRNQHLRGMAKYVKYLQQPAIVMGDLNVSMWSPYYRSMIESSGLRNARQGLGILPTHSIVAPQIAALSAPIDHCLVSSDVRVKDFRLGPAIGSDHLPIVAELLIEP